MPYRKVRVVDCQEVLRRWLANDGIRPIIKPGSDRKTVLEAAAELSFTCGDPLALFRSQSYPFRL